MPKNHLPVYSAKDLLAAVQNPSIQHIVVRGTLEGLPSFTLAPGQTLEGDISGGCLKFKPATDGIVLTSDNAVTRIEIQTAPDRVALGNETTTTDSLGTLSLTQVKTTGQVRFLLRDKARTGRIVMDRVDIATATTSTREERPSGFGFQVLQGALTLWNQQLDPQSRLQVQASRISVGDDATPACGSGIFLAGTEGGGLVEVSRLETGAINIRSDIPKGTTNLIAAAIFVLKGVRIAELRSRGPLVSQGYSDRVCNNWGEVDTWIAEEKLTSHGNNAMAFVNLGTICDLRLEQACETLGNGSCGISSFGGQISRADIDRIVTHGDGAMGIQIDHPIGSLCVRKGIVTYGGTGETLIKGVVSEVSSDALHTKNGGSIREVNIAGGLLTCGPGATTLCIEAPIESLRVDGGIQAEGEHAIAIQILGASTPLEHLQVKASKGTGVRLNRARITAIADLKAHGADGDLVVEADSTVQFPQSMLGQIGLAAGNAFLKSGPGKLNAN